MNKHELINAVAERTGLKKTAVEAVLVETFGTLARHLHDNAEVRLWGIGKIKKGVRAARHGRNPATGEMIEIPSRTVFRFVPAEKFSLWFNRD